jgi:serine/threonine protein kinase
MHKEVNFLKELNHKNIVKVEEFFFEESSMKVVMEYVEGGDLEKYINLKGALLP